MNEKRTEFLSEIKNDLEMVRTPLEILERVVDDLFKHYSTGKPKTRFYSTKYRDVAEIPASKKFFDDVDKYLQSKGIKDWSEVGIEPKDTTLIQSIRKKHLDKMKGVLETEWSLNYFREIGIKTTGKDGEKAVQILGEYDRHKNDSEITLTYLTAVFWVYLHTLGLKPNKKPFENLVRLFDLDIWLYTDEMPDDGISVWGILRYEVWKGKANREQWEKTYRPILEQKIASNKKYYAEMIRERKTVFLTADIQGAKFIKGGKNE